MTIVSSHGSFSTNTTTGNQSFAHGLGETPKVVIFMGAGVAADVTADGKFMLGAATSSTKRWTVTETADNVATTTDNSCALADDGCILLLNPDQTIQVKADFVSFDSTNITVNIGTTAGVAKTIHFLALGGTDIDVEAGIATITTGVGSLDITTGVTNPSAVWMVSAPNTSTAQIVSNARMYLGMGVTSLKMGSSGTFGGDGLAGSNTSTWQRTDRILAAINANQVVQAEVSLTSFSTNTVTVNKITSPGPRIVGVLVFGGKAQYDVHAFNQATATGNQSITGVGFKPVVQFWMSNTKVANTAAVAGSGLSFGYALSTTARKAFSFSEVDNDANGVGLSGYSATKGIRCITGTTTITEDTAADLVSFDTNGYTINNSNVDATARQIIGFSIGREVFGSSTAGGFVSGTAATTNTQTGSSSAAASGAGVADFTVVSLGSSSSDSSGSGVLNADVTKTGVSTQEVSSAGIALSGSSQDDTVVDPVVSSGDIFKTFQDASLRHWPAAVMTKAVTLSAGANVLAPVSDAFPFPVVRRTSGGVEVLHVEKADGSAFTQFVTPGIPFMAIESPTALDLIAEGELAVPRMTNRDLNIVIRDPSGNDAGVAGNPLVFEPSGSGLQPITDGGGSITVDVAAALTIDGTITVSGGSVTANAGTGPFPVAGVVAHGQAVSGNPILQGVVARTADPTPVLSTQVAQRYGDTLGKAVVLVGAPHDLYSTNSINLTTAVAADVLAAPGVGIRWVVCAVMATNSHATVSTRVEIRDGTTIKIRGQAASIDGGFTEGDGGGILFIGSANSPITARCATSGADVDVTVTAYKIFN